MVPVRPFTLAEIRERMGVSAAEVAEGIGVSVSALKRWEQGKSMPTVENFVKLCRYYRIGYGWVKLPV